MERGRFELEFEDTFAGDALDARKWVANYLPQWSSREAPPPAARAQVINR